MIELEGVTIRAGSFTLSDLNLKIPTASYAVLMGGTGQGKTTILEMVCGLRRPTAGRVRLAGCDVTNLKSADRQVGYVPQDLALFPTMTVEEHLAFALRLRRYSRAQIAHRVDEVAHALGIAPLLPRRVTHLSGGEAQRVALGRALSFRPNTLLLDEPLNALDETMRDRLCGLLQKIQQENGLTTLHVTHSRVEAQLLASKLFVLEGGKAREQPLAQLVSDSHRAASAARSELS
jgi:ABC-type sugar transport system ATPase subunit